LFPKNIDGTDPALGARKVRKLPTRTSPPIPAGGLLSSVLILAREEVIAALLGLMVELRGMKPRFLGEKESITDALKREGHVPVLIDCDHPDCTEETISQILEGGGDPVLFSPSRMQADVKRLASRYGTKSFTLPTDPDTFGRLLGS